MPETNHDELRIGRERIAQIFEYLKALNEHRNPAKRQISEQPWSMWLGDLPDHPAVKVGIIRAGPDSNAEEPTEETSRDDFVLKVQRPTLTSSPAPPNEITNWLNAGWEDPANDVTWEDSRNDLDAAGETVIVRFDDDRARSEALAEWIELRDEWRKNERPARGAMHVFERLYELRGRVEREAERLDFVLGDGILSWRREDGSIFHPILIQRVQLLFDP